MKNILILHRYPPKEVTGTNASYLEFLRQLSHEFRVYCLNYRDKDEGGNPEIDGVEFLKVPLSFNRGSNFDKAFKTYLWIFLVPFYVRKINKKYSLDLIYCDDSVPYYGFFTKLLNPSLKVVIRLGDLQSGYSWADRNLFIFRLTLVLETLMWKKVDGLIAISEPFRKFIIRQGIKEEKVKVVKESINLERIPAVNRVSQINDRRKIMFHGAVVRCKGLETLLEAWNIFHQKFPEAELVIAGGGSQIGPLKHLANKLKLTGIEFTGWYDNNDFPRLMKDVRMAVVMRSHNMANNFVVTTCLLENWAYKKPAIVPDLASFREVIHDGENGIYFKPGDSRDLADKMEFLYQHDEIYGKLAHNGWQTADKTFNHQKIATDMVKALKSYL